MLNTSGTFGTAMWRAFLNAVVGGMVAGLTVWQQSNDTRNAIVAGALVALGAIGARGLVEGSVDRSRQIDGNVKPSDVQPGNMGQA